MLRDVPFSALYWGSYETARPVFSRVLSDITTSPSATHFLSATTAGMLAAVTTHPFDVLKTLQQLEEGRVGVLPRHTAAAGTSPLSSFAGVDGSSNSSGSSNVSKKMSISSIYRTGGLRAMYRGLQLRLATVVPASAIMITVYEFVKQNLVLS